MTERLLFAIGVDVDAELEVEFNDWYNTDHLPSVVACPGFISGCRYALNTYEGEDAEGKTEGGQPRYWAIYEIESKDALETPELAAIAGFGRFEGAVRNVRRHWFTSLVPVVTSDP